MVHFVGSLGGHLELLDALAPVLADRPSVWITSEGARAEAMRRGGREVRTLPRLDRGSVALRSLAAGVTLALRERPRIVITSGAGIAVPFALVARLLGARLAFAETMARVTSGSRTGRLLSRLSDRVFVQWPELSADYPRATVCAPLLLEGVADVGGRPGAGTFVTLGSHDEPFDRLLSAVGTALSAGLLPAPVTIQSGVTAFAHPDAEVVPFVPPDRFAQLVGGAELVVCHGGAGAIATVLRAGRKPLVMARREASGEHVDDHQSQIVGKLAAEGLIVRLEGAIGPEEVATAATPTSRAGGGEAPAARSLRDEVAAWLASLSR